MGYLSIGGLSAGGMITDHPSYDLPPHVFNRVLDVEFTSQGVRPVVDEVEVFPSMRANPISVDKIKLGSSQDGWVYASTKDIYMIYNASHTKITRSESDGGTYIAQELLGWNLAILHGVPILNNGFDLPQQIAPNSPTDLVTNLLNWPTDLRAEIIRPYKNILIALRVQPGTAGAYDRQSLIWSQPADAGQVPPSWDYTDPATQAGLHTLSETDGQIIDGLTLGDDFLIYKEHTIWAMRFIGGIFVMSFKRRPGKVGLLSEGCVQQFFGGHFFVGQEDFYVYDGTGSPKSVGIGRITQEFFKRITITQKNKTFVEHDAPKKSMYVFFAADGAVWANQALVWRYDINVWSLRSVPHIGSATFGAVSTVKERSWDDFTTAWGGVYLAPWGTVLGTWASHASTPWLLEGDSASWESDTTIWDNLTDWDSVATTDIWDKLEIEPVVENLIMGTYLTEIPVYNSLTNISTANNVSWAGDSDFPALWLVPFTGARKQGYLLKKGIALVGKDHQGRLEVDRTKVKILTEFYPELAEGSAQFRFGTHISEVGEITWEDWELFDEALDEKLDPFISGKLLAFEVKGTGEFDNNWLLSGYGLEINLGGRY